MGSTHTRIFYASDVHGSDRCFRKFLAAGNFYKAHAIILGGDITGKMIIPIVEQQDHTYKTRFPVEKTIKNQEELIKIEQHIRDSGFYPYCTNINEMEELSNDPKKLETLFSHLMIERVREWGKLVDQNIPKTGVKCFIMPGNDDALFIDKALDEFESTVNPEGRVVHIDDCHEMISTGYSNPTPWNCPRDILEEELAKKVDIMIQKVKNIENCIFCFHAPPFDSGLDSAPEMDKQLRPKMAGGGISMVPVGSKAVRTAVERSHPLLGLHGHIHESRCAVKIGRTLCINAGSEYGQGILRGVIVNLESNGVKNYMFTSG